MRQLGKFTIDDLLTTLASGTERDPHGNLRKFIVELERVGVLRRLKRRVPGAALTSNGHVIWVVARDLGPSTPVCRRSGVYDPNSGAVLVPPLPTSATSTEGAAP